LYVTEHATFDEPAIPQRLKRPLAALWVSLGLHAAIIAQVQVVPPSMNGMAASVIEARLVPARDISLPEKPAVSALETAPVLASSPLPGAVAPPPTVSEAGAQSALPPVVGRSSAAPPVEAEAGPAAAPAGAISSAVDLTYYSARDVDVLPRALQEIVPAYPDDPEIAHLSGKVHLRLKIEADGRVVDADVVSSTPPGVFDAAARDAFRAARFSPARIKGRPVRALILIEVMFDGEGYAR